VILKPRPGVSDELALRVRDGYRSYDQWASHFESRAAASRSLEPWTAAFNEALLGRMREYHYLRSEVAKVAEQHDRQMDSMPAIEIATTPEESLKDVVFSALAKLQKLMRDRRIEAPPIYIPPGDPSPKAPDEPILPPAPKFAPLPPVPKPERQAGLGALLIFAAIALAFSGKRR
jgi:hypothetical protein